MCRSVLKSNANGESCRINTDQYQPQSSYRSASELTNST